MFKLDANLIKMQTTRSSFKLPSYQKLKKHHYTLPLPCVGVLCVVATDLYLLPGDPESQDSLVDLYGHQLGVGGLLGGLPRDHKLTEVLALRLIGHDVRVSLTAGDPELSPIYFFKCHGLSLLGIPCHHRDRTRGRHVLGAGGSRLGQELLTADTYLRLSDQEVSIINTQILVVYKDSGGNGCRSPI